jgi:hypothetical protein
MVPCGGGIRRTDVENRTLPGRGPSEHLIAEAVQVLAGTLLVLQPLDLDLE